MSEKTLFHGSPNLIEKPIYGYGNPHNDYGLGFYTTKEIELAKEWACPQADQDGFANEYLFSDEGLVTVNLQDKKYHILNWLALLLKHRTFRLSNDLAAAAKEYLLSHFFPDVQSADVIIGYRADDSYFSFANAFLNSALSLAQLQSAMYLGNLGEQTVLMSKTAFQQLSFQTAHPALASQYYVKRMSRDLQAREIYQAQRQLQQIKDAVYILDIIREEWQNDDARLFRNLSQ
ncbi:MAG: DUF3990 domain-containing protein [Erysipelotrichaceae bacterium]|jgi:hypothetical protein|nr:DUF3990 domain-containing protein [Erysipelotrichaceae bacterium]